MNVFFEIADCAVAEFGHKYLALYNVESVAISGYGAQTMQMSERVWTEGKSGVKYLKNRRTGSKDSPRDMKEFVWVKLKSRPWHV
jgi:hypothetical protein